MQIMSNKTVTFKLFCLEFSDIAVVTFIYIYTYFVVARVHTVSYPKACFSC